MGLNGQFLGVQGSALIEAHELCSVEEWKLAADTLRTLRPKLNTEAFIAKMDQLVADGYRLVGVEIEGLIVSMASFTCSPHAMLGRELLIHDMATRTEMAGRGYGRLILNKLEEIANREGCKRIFVHTRHAQEFYQKCGFESYSTGLIKLI